MYEELPTDVNAPTRTSTGQRHPQYGRAHGSAAESMYEELPTSSVNAPLLPTGTSTGQRPHPQHGHAHGSGPGNKAARVIATSLACIYTMWCMMKFAVFLIELFDNEDHPAHHTNRTNGAQPGNYAVTSSARSHTFNEDPDDPEDQYNVGIAGALFLVNVVGSFEIFAAGCCMAFAKKCGCHTSLFKISNLAKMQLAGSVVCTLVALGWMIFVAEWCQNGAPGGGNSTNHNHTSPEMYMFGPQLHPTMHRGNPGNSSASGDTPCFKHSYWMRDGPIGGLAGWGMVDVPVCIVLLGCTCVSVFQK